MATTGAGTTTNNPPVRKRGRPRKYPRPPDCTHNNRPEHANGVCYQCSSNANNKEKKLTQISKNTIEGRITKRSRKKTSNDDKIAENQNVNLGTMNVQQGPNTMLLQQQFGANPDLLMYNYQATMAQSAPNNNPYFAAYYNYNNFAQMGMQNPSLMPNVQNIANPGYFQNNNSSEMMLYNNSNNGQQFYQQNQGFAAENIPGNSQNNQQTITTTITEDASSAKDSQNNPSDTSSNTNVPSYDTSLVISGPVSSNSNTIVPFQNTEQSLGLQNQDISSLELQSCNILSQLRNDLTIHNKSCEEKRIKKMRENFANGIIHFNVGGKLFTTTSETLMKQNYTVFYDLVQNPFIFKLDESGYFFFDRDPEYFGIFLNYLRTLPNKFDVNFVNDMESSKIQSLLKETEYYRLADLEGMIRLEVATASFNAGSKKNLESNSSKQRRNNEKENDNVQNCEITSNVSELTIQENPTGAKMIMIQKSSTMKFLNGDGRAEIHNTVKEYNVIDFLD